MQTDGGVFLPRSLGGLKMKYLFVILMGLLLSYAVVDAQDDSFVVRTHEIISDYEEIGESAASTYQRFTPDSCVAGFEPSPGGYSTNTYDICVVRGIAEPRALFLVISNDSYYADVFAAGAVLEDGSELITHVFQYGTWAGEVSYVHFLGFRWLDYATHVFVESGEASERLAIPR